MKHSLYLLITALLVFALSGCSADGKLTNEKAQQAVTRWLNGNGTAVVTGVLEVPQENMAKADVGLSNFVWNSPKNDAVTAYMFGPGGASHTYSGRADAIFAHYNDGRWVLTKIVTPNGSWDNLNIVASGEGATSPTGPTPTLATAKSKPSLFQKMKCWTPFHDKPFSATVSADQAKFIIPVGEKDQWEWNVEGDGVQVTKMDYRWEINVGDVQFGFYHWSIGQPQTGDLEALLAAGDVSAQRVIWNQGHTQPQLTGLAGVSAQPTCDNVVILINGKENVAAIFSSRPEKARFRIHQPGKAFAAQDVSISYAN